MVPWEGAGGQDRLNGDRQERAAAAGSVEDTPPRPSSSPRPGPSARGSPESAGNGDVVTTRGWGPADPVWDTGNLGSPQPTPVVVASVGPGGTEEGGPPGAADETAEKSTRRLLPPGVPPTRPFAALASPSPPGVTTAARTSSSRPRVREGLRGAPLGGRRWVPTGAPVPAGPRERRPGGSPGRGRRGGTSGGAHPAGARGPGAHPPGTEGPGPRPGRLPACREARDREGAAVAAVAAAGSGGWVNNTPLAPLCACPGTSGLGVGAPWRARVGTGRREGPRGRAENESRWREKGEVGRRAGPTLGPDTRPSSPPRPRPPCVHGAAAVASSLGPVGTYRASGGGAEGSEVSGEEGRGGKAQAGRRRRGGRGRGVDAPHPRLPPPRKSRWVRCPGPGRGSSQKPGARGGGSSPYPSPGPTARVRETRPDARRPPQPPVQLTASRFLPVSDPPPPFDILPPSFLPWHPPHTDTHPGPPDRTGAPSPGSGGDGGHRPRHRPVPTRTPTPRLHRGRASGPGRPAGPEPPALAPSLPSRPPARPPGCPRAPAWGPGAVRVGTLGPASSRLEPCPPPPPWGSKGRGGGPTRAPGTGVRRPRGGHRCSDVEAGLGLVGGTDNHCCRFWGLR
ncbi:collagen alpha-1(I) chain-like [Tachyglossus aculeatus]|uniref:collagen alpha-1(I) chain-like n=1 Tax=Tachyglossus aculeatus TaxID=9261 RepID=UPI0018F377D7|nr:collagen alpha-1(I) chain-like [Tachyglossus aculeatus]